MDKVDTVNEKPNEENTKEAPLPEVNQPKEINTDLNLQEVNQPKEINTDLNEEEKKNSILKNYSSIDFMTLEKISSAISFRTSGLPVRYVSPFCNG